MKQYTTPAVSSPNKGSVFFITAIGEVLSIVGPVLVAASKVISDTNITSLKLDSLTPCLED